MDIKMITEEQIVNFLALNGKDHKGRHYVDYLAFSHNELEIHHDYIQWMFPLHESSKFNPECPVITPEIVEKVMGYATSACGFEAAVKRMESFLGIGAHFDIDIQKKHFFEGNHNMLRITRIIRSIRLFLGDESAKAFYDNVFTAAMLAVPEINSVTRQYWVKAMHEDKWESMK